MTQHLLGALTNAQNNTNQVKMLYLVRTRRRSSENEYVAFNVPITEEIILGIKNSLLHDVIEKITGKTITDFNPTNSEIGTLEVLPTNNINNFQSIYSSISATFPENIDELDFNSIWGYCFIINDDTPGNEILLFKKHSHPKLLDRGWLLSLVNGAYNILEDKIVTIDSDVDALSFGGNTYVLNKYKFEKFFNFSNAYQEVVNRSISSLQQLEVIENFDEFAQQCLISDTLTRRLVKIIDESRFQTLQSCLTNVPQVINDFALNVRFANNKIVFDDTSTITDIITLIRGACVIGALDQTKYLANDTKTINNP